MRIRFGLFVAFVVCSLSSAASGQQAATPYQEVLKGSVAECDAQRAACLLAGTSSTEINKCDQTWRACRSALNPDIDALATAAGSAPGSSPRPVAPEQGDQNEVDGCTLGKLAYVINAQDPCGCSLGKGGSGSTKFGEKQGTDSVGTLGRGEAVLPLPCNLHDKCYQTCHDNNPNGKAECDTEMYTAMVGVCDAAYGGSNASCPYGGLSVLVCFSYSIVPGLFGFRGWYEERKDCYAWAERYKLGLDYLPQAKDAYNDRQKQYCKSGS